MPLSFKYPITKADGSEFKSAKELLGQLSGESAGFYLLSTNAFWHGGLHISDDTSGYVADKHPVRSMATGEVVAYRLNDDYCTSTWGKTTNAQTLKYSTSFCLVRHTYASPHKKPAAPATPAATAAADQGPQNTLVFYSLYMHLLPYVGYAQRVVIQGASALAYIQFPGTGGNGTPANATRPLGSGSDTASNATLYGLEPVAPPIPLLSGTELSVLDELDWVSGNQITKLLYVAVSMVPTSNEAALVDPNSPSRVPSVTVGQRYWVTANGSRLSTVSGTAIRKRPMYWKCSRKAVGTLIRPLSALRDPSGQNAGVTIHAMPAGSKVRIEREQLLKQGGKKKPFAQVKVMSLGEGDAGLVAPGHTVWISSAEADLVREPVIPDTFNSVVICDPPLPIEAGATIGYLGLYETPGPGDEGKTSRQQVHVEIFTGDPKFDDFFANAAGLTEGKKYKMAGTDGAPAKVSASAGVNTFAPGTDPLLLPVAVDTTGSLAKQDALHKKWFPVEGIADSGVLNGWVPESRLKDVVQYDWEKLGFRKVEEANDNADGYMDPEKMPAFFKTIYKLIHKSTDGEVTPDELIAANHNSAVRNALAHVVAKHPSEWQGKSDAAKWNVIKEHEALLKNDPKRLKHELERIDALSWWDEIQGVKDFPVSPSVWHFNPVAFLDVMKNGCSCDDDVTRVQLTACAAGNSAADVYVDALNKAFKDFGITACINKAHFIAQTMVESANYSVTKEILNSNRPHPAYWPYIGRGLIQLTGEDNYRNFGAAVSEDFLSNAAAMTKLEASPHALLSAAWYYKHAGVNQYGEDDDFIMVTMAINGGFNGYNARLQKVNQLFGILDVLGCVKLNINGVYNFEDSVAYGKKKPSFAWGMWHDPGSNREGPTKNHAEAIKGYQRYLVLDQAAGSPKNPDGSPKDKNWYGIGSRLHPKSVVDYCRERLLELTGATA
jgi:predicted chitinase